MSYRNREAPRARKGASIADRLALHSIAAPSGCVIWTGFRSSFGHGRIQVAGKCLYAHRVSYELHVGPIPDGLQLDHLCRRPACIRPDHLQPVTAQVNVLRGTSPGAAALRREKCSAGHSFAEHGVVRCGRRVCRLCQINYCREWRARRAVRAAGAA